MLETLLKILSVHASSPEIMLEEDGCLGLDWPKITVSINPAGGVAWACSEPSRHGTDIDELLRLIEDGTANEVI
jgi:hypothetical protein